jgi:hypothetical protein
MGMKWSGWFFVVWQISTGASIVERRRSPQILNMP